MVKRLAIFFLSCLLVIALFPAMAFAAEGPPVPVIGEGSVAENEASEIPGGDEACIGDPAYTEIPGETGPAGAGAIETFSGDPIIHITETGLWSAEEWEVLRLTNIQRLNNGLRPLSTFKTLQQAAGKRSDEIVTLFDHYRPNGSLCFTVLNEYGISYSSAGENIAAGYNTPASVLTGWMNSSGHKANILTSGFVHMGAGYTYASSGYRYHWVQLFIGGCSVTNLEVGSLSANPVFRPGSNIDDLGLIAVLTCSHGKSYIPLTSAMCSGYDKYSLNEQIVTVNYGSLSTSFSLQLEARVTYEGNGADYGSPPTDYTDYKSGDSVTVMGSGTLVKNGFALSGWTKDLAGIGTLYRPGDKFTIGSDNVILYAKWERLIIVTTQPAAQVTVAEGQISAMHQLTVAAELDGSSAGLDYQWYSSLTASNTTGSKIPGATSAVFSIPTDLSEGVYYYFCEVSSPGAQTTRSNISTVTVTPPTNPVITISAQPADKTVAEGDISGSLSVTAHATQGAALTYTWYECNSDGASAGGPVGAGSVFAIPTNLTAGTWYYICEVSSSSMPGIQTVRSNVATVTVLPPAAADGLVVSPTHVVLTESSDIAVFTAKFKGGVATLSELEWSVSPAPTPGSGSTFTDYGDGTVAVELASSSAMGDILVVTAVYQGKYTSSATVEILPGGVTPGVSEARLLETKATINIAKESPVVRVPVLVSNRAEVQSAYMSTLSEISALVDQPPLTFTPDVTLEVNRAKAGQTEDWQILEGFSASMSDFDSRYIEIEALPDPFTGKYPGTTKNVKVTVGGAPAGSITLVIEEKYPKITVKAGQLNLFYPDEGTGFSAVASDGTNVTVLGIEHFADKDKTIASKQPGDPLKLQPLKTGTANFNVTLKLDGYAHATKGGDTVKASVKVVNAVPKLKLSAQALTMAGNQPVTLGLLPGKKNVTLASLGTIRGVELDDTDVNRYQGNGSIRLPGNIAAGVHALKVDFAGGAGIVSLKLTVKRVDPSKATVSSATKSVVVNTSHNNGDIITINITPNAGNLVISDWVRTNTKVEMPGGIDFAAGANSLTFSVTDKALLTPTAKAVSLEFNSASSPLAKPLKISLSITGKDPLLSASLKGKIDIANPASEITATVKLTNTTSTIASVKLYDQAFDANKRFIDPVGTGAGESAYFDVGAVNGNTFTIKAKAGKLVPGATKKLSLSITLQNGEVVTSWATGSNGVVKDTKAISVKPVQTAFKATQDKKTITLYKLAPHTGEQLALDLITPESASLSHVRINGASVGKCDYFELVRSGRNTWELKLKDGFDPYLKDSKGKSVYKSSYTVKLELWAEGAYQLVDQYGNPTTDTINGKPIALTSGKYKSKPTIVKVKVNLK